MINYFQAQTICQNNLQNWYFYNTFVEGNLISEDWIFLCRLGLRLLGMGRYVFYLCFSYACLAQFLIHFLFSLCLFFSSLDAGELCINLICFQKYFHELYFRMCCYQNSIEIPCFMKICLDDLAFLKLSMELLGDFDLLFEVYFKFIFQVNLLNLLCLICCRLSKPFIGGDQHFPKIPFMMRTIPSEFFQ